MKSKIINITVVSLGVLILSGCSSKYVVTYDSNPQGASLVCGGKNWGYTPKKLYYDESVKKQSTLNVSNCSANWISGARKNYPSNLKIFPEGGTIIAVQRPNIVGYEKDAQFALQVQQMQYQRRQTEVAESSAKTQNYQNQQRNYQLQQQNYQLQNINNYMRYGY